MPSRVLERDGDEVASIISVRGIPELARIGVFSPSDALDDDRCTRMTSGVHILESFGYEVEIGRHVHARLGSRAGSAGQRLQDIYDLTETVSIDALVATHGGKAAIDLLVVDAHRVARHRKPIFGFSDVCVLLNAIAASSGLVTFYGPNVLTHYSESEWSDLRLVRNTSRVEASFGLLGDRRPVRTRILRGGRATGLSFGGNLECFVLGIVATRYPIQRLTEGGILFWETGEPNPSKIYQLMSVLRIGGVLSLLGGMVVGGLGKCEIAREVEDRCLTAVTDAVAGLEFPILYWPSFGHDHFENPILPIGAAVELCTANGVLRATKPFVES